LRNVTVDILGWILIAIPLVLMAYAYLAYPAVLRLLARDRNELTVPSSGEPMVSIVVPAYNEEAQIRGAIEALIAQDYPAPRRQILILSDASVDRTDEIVKEYHDRGVELLRMPVRGGKTAAENASCALLKGDIIINTDSSIRLHPQAVRRLVDAMRDPRVGVASSCDVSVTPTGASRNEAEAGYVDYEMRIRAMETATGGIVGASGSGYAIRASLHRLPVRDDLSRDFSAALTARTHGFTAVSVDDALCYVPRTGSLRAEYRRKVRTISRGVETLLHNKHLLNPARYGLFSWKLISHKVCRWLVPPSGVLGVLGLAVLATHDGWAAVLLSGAAAIALIAGIGALWPDGRPRPRAVSIIAFATAANIAVIHSLIRVMVGHEDHLWEPTRRSVAVPSSDAQVTP
jgi:cellulose synthase/poly-beta-1,6-N-acetylglucosamine synthase-like glycosyltransferase